MKASDAKGLDYSISNADARDLLMGASLLPADMRAELLRRHMQEHGPEALVELFAQFIGLANSVVANCRVQAEDIGMMAGFESYQTERFNLPTIFGALNGVQNIVKPVPGMCDGCAYRQGTPANQSPSTSIDADDAVRGEIKEFCCHQKQDAKGRYSIPCAGFVKARETRGDR